jgi:hypothetical protein
VGLPLWSPKVPVVRGKLRGLSSGRNRTDRQTTPAATHDHLLVPEWLESGGRLGENGVPNALKRAAAT